MKILVAVALSLWYTGKQNTEQGDLVQLQRLSAWLSACAVQTTAVFSALVPSDNQRRATGGKLPPASSKKGSSSSKGRRTESHRLAEARDGKAFLGKPWGERLDRSRGRRSA
eukprot:CAMPEP_0117648098 /NCGR_PEP_ID=MMETSP0804-20121206/207_1 /TAXON_ID=1074897 /ORGANISM="Tetraselmis astigmatica, Strain CCMP880" /LENGTH=111 /DNA_ID=CAMNT_0005453645 /DNA_START=730 /DNA_END=1064 /DNA_ORIENTATION=-